MDTSMDKLLFQVMHTFVLFLNETQHLGDDHFLSNITSADTNDPTALDYYASVAKTCLSTFSDSIIEMRVPVVLTDGEQTIDLSEVVEKCSKEETRVFWRHLLTLVAIGDKTKKALVKTILSTLEEPVQALVSDRHFSNEEQFLRTAINSIEQSLEGKDLDTDNKMEIFTTLMTNSSVTSLITDIQSKFAKGELDLGKMLSASQVILNENGQDINIMDEISKMAPLLQTGAFNIPTSFTKQNE